MDFVRLARAIAAIDHPQVCGTLDFNHAYIMTTFRGMDHLEAMRAFGMGHLHLPVGWVDIPMADHPASTPLPARHGDDRRVATPPLG